MILHSKIIGSGSPLLILHGFLGMGDNWKTLAKQFSALGFEVHLIDQRNHGRSFHAQEFNYEVMAEDLWQYCKHYKLKSCIVLGHSMGGKIAMLFSSLYPEIVFKLIVADISPRFYPIHHQQILEGLGQLHQQIISSRKQADNLLSNYVSDLGTRQFLLKNLYWKKNGELGLRINFTALKANVAEIGEALPSHLEVVVPTLFLRGDKSEYIGNEDIALIHAQFREQKVQTIVNAGHWLHAENPKAFYECVSDFIN